MTAGQRPAAQTTPGHQVVVGHRLDHGAALLILELSDIEVPSPRSDGPAQKDVTGRLEKPLARYHALATRRIGAWAEEPLEDGRLGLLDLEEDRVLVGALVEQHDDRRQADAADADHLERQIDELVAVEQRPSVHQERLPVGRQPELQRLIGHVGSMDQERRPIADPPPAVRADLGQLGKFVEAVVLGSTTGRSIRGTAARAC